jgi:hypothetical protein
MTIHAGPTYALLGAAVVLGLLALVVALRGVRQRRLAEHFGRHSVAGTAEVTAITAKDISAAGDPVSLYFPTVRFSPTADAGAAGSGQVEVECFAGTPAPPPQVGDEVAIRYDPQHPERVVLDGTDHAVGAGRTAFLLAKGLLVLAVGLPLAWGVLVLVVWSS